MWGKALGFLVIHSGRTLQSRQGGTCHGVPEAPAAEISRRLLIVHTLVIPGGCVRSQNTTRFITLGISEDAEP